MDQYLERLLEYQDNNEHKQEGWKERWIEIHRNLHAPLRDEYLTTKSLTLAFELDELLKQIIKIVDDFSVDLFLFGLIDQSIHL